MGKSLLTKDEVKSTLRSVVKCCMVDHGLTEEEIKAETIQAICNAEVSIESKKHPGENITISKMWDKIQGYSSNA